ncbi:hypothetical protein [Leptothoe sp. PORK10 BA2]|uniref:hypothetical protein n=1 Tax=Leptothoe sp. PORK10 BA2 TaxID=3110254 RepID=UPI002B211B07|nr:hypothetical protein [Leptothoe sp. PORK10 BA2]MEA5465967.1 hypothetical protein [Leptothoe sp. PORK10 BA2]
MVTLEVAVMFYGRSVAKKIKFGGKLLGRGAEGAETEENAVTPMPIFSCCSGR